MKRVNINLLLALLVVVLVNVVGQRAYLRFDLTSRDVYSLSPVSRELVSTLENPLRVHVFYSDDVPAVYGTVRQYLTDILSEYENAAEQNFTFQVHSMGSESDRQAASEYGVNPIQIREVRQDAYQQSQAYMGAALLYGDRIEVVNEITSTQGLEYRLTTTMQSMVSAVDALAGISGQVQMEAYASQNLEQIGIQGLSDLESTLNSVHQTLNEQYAGKLAFDFSRPSDPARIEELANRFGLQRLTWQSQTGGEEIGVLGIVLRHDDRFESLPIQIARTLSGYQIEQTEQIRTRIEDSLTVLVQANPSLAYITGHGEKALSDSQRGAGRLQALMQDRYQIEEVDLSSSSIPEGAQTVIINGPRQQFSEWELYQLDQFLLRGGSVLAMVDPFRQVGGQQQRPQYMPINTGLRDVLAHYGVEPQQNYALDTESYVARQQQREDVQVYNAPLVSGDRLARNNPITSGLNQALFLNTSSLRYPGSAEDAGSGSESAISGQEGVTYDWLARTSENGWLMSENITLNPMMLRPPQNQRRQSAIVAAVAEGTFSSYFSEPVPPPEPESEESGDGEEGTQAEQQPQQAEQGTEIETGAHLSRGTSPGRLLVAGTSEIAGAQLLGQGQQTPNTILIQNMVDWLNGNEAIPPMRTKGLGASQLGETSQATRTMIRIVHVVLVPALTVVVGLLVWLRRRQLRRYIQHRLQQGVEA